MKIVYSYYSLDLIHSGHILMMKNAKSIAGKEGKLIVGILTDKAIMEQKDKPTLPLRERMRIAEAIKYVDLVVAQETYSPIPNCKKIRPDILLESASHKDKDLKETKRILKPYGVKIIVLPYYPLGSSSEIKRRIRCKN